MIKLRKNKIEQYLFKSYFLFILYFLGHRLTQYCYKSGLPITYDIHGITHGIQKLIK